LCDVERYVSAQTFAFLDIGKKSRFVAWKSVPDQQRSFRPWPAGRSGFFRLRRTGVRLTGKPLYGLGQNRKSSFLEANSTRGPKGYLGIDHLFIEFAVKWFRPHRKTLVRP
jgi:hypothetical protein